MRNRIFLLALLILFPTFSVRETKAQNSKSQQCLEDFEVPFADPDSWAPFVGKIAEGFNVERGPGYAILDTEDWFPDEDFDDFFEALPKGTLFSTIHINKPTKQISEIRHRKKFYFLRYGRWLRRLLTLGLPEEVSLKGPIHELWLADEKTRPNLGWHTDGMAYITAVVYAKGKGMRGATDQGEFQVDKGKTILFTSDLRAERLGAESLYHASSNLSEEKIAAVYFFYVKGEFPVRKPAKKAGSRPKQNPSAN